MANRRSTVYAPVTAPNVQRDPWAWHPPLPLAGVPVFVWPPRPLAALKYLLSLTFLGSVLVPFGALAALSWLYLQPALERCAEFRADWILQMYAATWGSCCWWRAALHLYFYTFGRQDAERKFDPRGLGTNDRKFFARNQVWDNMLWTCASGVTIWTAYEAGFMWAYANDLLPFYLRVNEHPVWFAAHAAPDPPSGPRCTSTSCIACCTGGRSTGSPTRCTTATTTPGRGPASPCTPSSTCSTSAAS